LKRSKKNKNSFLNFQFSCPTESLRMSNERDYEALQKIIFVGDSGVGKTSLLTRYLENTFKQTEFTISVEFNSKLYDSNGTVVKLQLWDIHGGRVCI
jgi:GTPase SAR1 family protein